ncbi:MAG: AAA family ATPase [Myxococcales bacterium]|nr:AAA family ATPase [Myxococcales bacterium]
MALIRSAGPRKARSPREIRAAFLDEGTRDVYERSPAEAGDEPSGELEPNDASPSERPARFRWSPDHRIEVLDRDPRAGLLLLERLPTLQGTRARLALRPNTYTIGKQIQAIQRLQDAPMQGHRPLIDLLLPDQEVAWQWVVPAQVDTWRILTDATRAGTAEQRDFVSRALATPDFALLEGPPGSGKTTAICELVLQMVEAGQRVLLVASTHVAVDNVLERMIEHEHTGALVAVRIGDEGSVSDRARPYCLRRRLETEQRALRDFLERQRPGSAAQAMLRDRLRRGRTAIEAMVLDAANLVCGTTIGILQHPDIRGTGGRRPESDGERRPRQGGEPMFDMMILDEASKTTFQEFLVPAVLARRWIIVGDPKQLSPYVEQEEFAVGLEAVLVGEHLRNACVDVFSAQRGRARGATLVVTKDAAAIEAYRRQAEGRGALAVVAEAGATDIALADVVLASPDRVAGVVDDLPLDLRAVRGDAPGAWRARRRSTGEGNLPTWSGEVAWRLVRSYEQRFGGNARTVEALRDDLAALEPVDDDGERLDRFRLGLAGARRVALPSVIELLRFGFEGGERHRATALNRGFLPEVLADRRVLLEFQHRMHPEISLHPRLVVYDDKALQDAPGLAAARAWSYRGHRAVWVHVDGHCGDDNINRAEVDAVMAELSDFVAWAGKSGLRGDGKEWEVAVLSFYRGQERALRERLRKATSQANEYRTFRWKGVPDRPVYGRPFPGPRGRPGAADLREAAPEQLLESQNRLNVALTRARYGLRIFGNRHRLGHSEAPLLKALQTLPSDVHWDGGER